MKDEGPPEGMEERRQLATGRRASPRRRTSWRARIVPAAGDPIECRVADISATGAGLEVQVPVPYESFDLVFDGNAHPRRSCRVAWRRPTRIGVKFE